MRPQLIECTDTQLWARDNRKKMKRIHKKFPCQAPTKTPKNREKK